MPELMPPEASQADLAASAAAVLDPHIANAMLAIVLALGACLVLFILLNPNDPRR